LANFWYELRLPFITLMTEIKREWVGNVRTPFYYNGIAYC
jgi:hypothetical protein